MCSKIFVEWMNGPFKLFAMFLKDVTLIYSFNKCVLGASYIPAILPGTDYIIVNLKEDNSSFHGSLLLGVS